MSADPNKKTARTFQCRDALWTSFEQMARDLECSVDYLINEAMKTYARQRAQASQRTLEPLRSGESSPSADPLAPLPSPLGGAAPMALPAALRPLVRPSISAPLPPPPGRMPPVPPASRSSAPLSRSVAPPPLARPGGPGLQVPPIPRAIVTPPPMGAGRSVVPPPSPRMGATPGLGLTNGLPAPAPHAAMLTLIYNGERHPITKERFVIGRGKQSSDLMLKDPNVSRQHALVEFQNGTYFMVDMGSTNGVSFNGERVARQPIAEGDAFRICDHDLVFTYR